MIVIDQANEFVIVHPDDFGLVTSTFRAESWEAWDMLTADRGWRLDRWLVNPNEVNAQLRVQKTRGKMVVLSPTFERGTVVCPHCVRGTWKDSNGSKFRCSTCNGIGRVKDE